MCGSQFKGATRFAVAFDGANIWVVNLGSSTVTKLRAADGALLGTFHVGFSPQGIAFDGANIWVMNNGDSTVTKLRASDGALVGPLRPAPARSRRLSTAKICGS
jgi:DNA-binding beta-propeller fold protein YncE